ncbi:MAG TPA: CDP-alcohol phosphatidyltransferase family protein [Candidatus Eisenbergiella intestinigallinarum]|uniref:CDP-diacylglycerol--glycerol-3-phosphate 3-phosphatidyltransferase n=1 Tax=Candidatus Eisenbergiella intestinigallinarum TaxID=2838549 RepID=A0A9D2TTP8_9FIRM|nr:CDP-alcohol phosphatidyltransferase family protein [Candidatus Eisenbergiella intestinigallinarum]
MKNRIDKREIFSIPNLMGYFRILLIPLFSWMYCTADSTGDYYAAAVVVGVSGLTDMFDGKIARRFHMITELGKFIDPLADKLTQAALLICLAVRYPLMRAVLVLFVIKEGFMAVMGALLLPRGKKLDGAMWFGKVCTAVLYAVLFLLLLLPGIGTTAANVLIGICGAFLLFSFLMYIPVFRRMWKESEGDRT